MTPKFKVGQLVQFHFSDANLVDCGYFPIKSIMNDEEGIKYEVSNGEIYDEIDLISLQDSYERLQDLKDLVEKRIQSAEYLLETNGNPRFKLGDKVYCHQETDWYEFQITEIYWDDEDEMYIYSNDADEIFCADMLTLVPYKRDE